MKASEAKKLIGQRVSWIEILDYNRGSYREYFGTLEEVQGRNVCINGDWKWLPSLTEFKAIQTLEGER